MHTTVHPIITVATPSAMKGGLGAAPFAQYVYGDAPHQMANPALGNEIMMRNPTGFTGGKRRKNHNKRGGSMVVDLAVPAMLLLAQQNTRKRGNSKSMRKSRRSNRRTQRGGKRSKK